MSDALNTIFDSNAGVAQLKVGTTIQTFSLSLAAGLVLFGVQFGTFLVIRNYLWAKRIFQPRTFLIPVKDRVKPPSPNPFRWIVTVFKTPEDPEILHKAGMDAYFFLRYLKMCLKMFFPMAILILPILIPLNVSHGKGTGTDQTPYNVTGLDTLAWSNVSPENTDRYWAHLVLGVGVVAWVCYLFHRELMNYVIKRQEYLGSPSHRLKASSTTVLITDIPKDICNVDALTELYDDFPGGIRRIWINRNFKSLVEKDETRRHYEDLLENAETDMLRKAIKRQSKQHQAGSSEATEATDLSTELIRGRTQSDHRKATTPADCEADLKYEIETKAAWTTYLTPKQRQTMRIPKTAGSVAFRIPILGRFFATKVDTIYYCRRELARLNQEIESDIDEAESCSPNGSAFIQFNSQKAAHLACQSVADSMPRKMTQRTVELSPADINWPALDLTSSKRLLRLIIFLLLFLLVVVVFGIISFFTGILSRASTLADSTSWLRWIGDLPSWLISFIQGTLPPVIQVIVLSGPTPIVLRAMTNSTRGATTGSQGERSLQLWYFILLLFELFIIPTISSGLTSTVQSLLQSPTSVPNLLATELPKAANYYFSFLVLQAFSISAASILQTIRLFNYYVIGGANTPDRVFNKLAWTNLTRIGSNIPWYTTFAVIGLVYSVIAPLILVFVLFTFSLFYIIIKNNLLYVVRTGNVDGGGLFFPHAINQTFTGIYFMEFCLIGLFFLVEDSQGNIACTAQGVIMAVVFALTIIYQTWLSVNFNGLLKYAPVRLEGDALRRDKEYEKEYLTSAVQDPEPDVEKKNNTASRSKNRDRAFSIEPPQNLEVHDRRRRSSRSIAIIGESARSKEMQIQQNKDAGMARDILARINRPLDEQRLAQLESNLAAMEARAGHVIIPKRRDVEARMMNDPISKIIMQHNDELEDLTSEERDMLVSVAFTHPVLRASEPSVWLPRDDLGISDDEVRRTRELSKSLVVVNRGAFFNKKLKVEIDQPPPDMSEFALILREL